MGVDVSARARTLGIDTEYRDLRDSQVAQLPVRIAVIGQGASASTYPTNGFQSSRASTVGETAGYGSPLHLAAKKLLPVNGDGVGTILAEFFPLEDAAGGVASTGDIAPTGSPTSTKTIRVYVGEVRSEAITLIPGTDDATAAQVAKIVAAVSPILDMPMTVADGATSADFTAKWQGESGDGIKIRIEGSVPGVTFGITQPNGGAANPDVDVALNQFGTQWYTMVLNCMNPDDTATLDKIATFGEGRWGAQERKPFIAFTGNVDATVALASAVPEARKTDRVNGFLVAPGSGEMPFLMAARSLVRIARQANEDPATDYGGGRVDGIVPGADGDQWTFAERDEALKKGTSSIEVKDGVINLSDTVTFYHPTGDDLPGYQYVVDIVKLQNQIYNLEQIFDRPDWKGKPLIPSGQVTTNANARTPSMAAAAINTRIDAMALAAILSDPETAKAATRAWIDTQNPKRLNASTVQQQSGNTNIVSVDLFFGFYFGTAPIAA